MKCQLCDKPAMRHGTNGRAYCFAHDSEAFAQVSAESRRNSMKQEMISNDVQLEWRRERALRAV